MRFQVISVLSTEDFEADSKEAAEEMATKTRLRTLAALDELPDEIARGPLNFWHAGFIIMKLDEEGT